MTSLGKRKADPAELPLADARPAKEAKGDLESKDASKKDVDPKDVNQPQVPASAKPRVIKLKRVSVKSGAGAVGKGAPFKTFTDWNAASSHVYCGRQNQWVKAERSAFCNPHAMRSDSADERKRVIAEFERLQLERDRLHVALLKELTTRAHANANIKQLSLGCWCSPSDACHVDSLITHVLRAQQGADAPIQFVR